MPRFFVRSSQIENGTVTLLGDDAHHISRSLRMARGEEITVSDMQSNEYRCRLEEFLPDCVLATVLETKKGDTEPPFELVLFQALPKGDKLDTVIQKAVECGVAKIIPFESERCIVHIKEEAEAHKTERRRRIAAEAAKQSGRGILPEVLPSVSFAQMLESAKNADITLFCYEGDGTVPIGRLLAGVTPRNTRRIAVVIGSEGGFSLEETERARAAGFLLTGLGKRILRTETAATFALAAICAVTELS